MTWRRRAVLLLMLVSVGGLWTGFYRFGIRGRMDRVGWSALLVFHEYVFPW